MTARWELIAKPPQIKGVGGPAGSKEAAQRCTELNWTVGPTLKKGDSK